MCDRRRDSATLRDLTSRRTRPVPRNPMSRPAHASHIEDWRAFDQLTSKMPFTDVADSVLKTIGRTPVVRLKRLVPPGGADVFVKLEYFNPTGSYKDRMALAMIEGAEARGALQRRHARRRIHRRQHRVVAGDGLRGERLRVRAALIRRVRARKDPDDGGVWRGRGDRAERRRQGDPGAVRSLSRANRDAER